MAHPSTPELTSTDLRRLAADLFVLGFPLMLADVVRRSHPMEPNRLLHLPDAAAALAPGLSREGACTIRCSAWIDLSDGPVVLHLPHMHGRYFSLTLIDSAGEPFAGIGSRTHDDAGCDLAVAAPRWRGEFTGALKARRAPSDVVWAVSRITANSLADRPEAKALAQKQCLVPLRWTRDPCEPTRLMPLELPASTCIQHVAEMAADAFSHRLGMLLGRAPHSFRDAAGQAIEARLATLDPASHPTAEGVDRPRAMISGFADALAAIRTEAARVLAPDATGWRTHRWTSSSPRGEAPIARAARAYTALGAPMPDDVLSLSCEADESGRRLSGTERYRMHFPVGGLPPVDAFWSLSATLDEPEPAGRRNSLSDRSDVTYNRDGSLDLLIQHAAPPPTHARNWLPIPPGDFHLDMRLHWPRPAALSGNWRMPSVERLGSGFGRRAGARAPPAAFPAARTARDDLQDPQSAWR